MPTLLRSTPLLLGKQISPSQVHIRTYLSFACLVTLTFLLLCKAQGQGPFPLTTGSHTLSSFLPYLFLFSGPTTLRSGRRLLGVTWEGTEGGEWEPTPATQSSRAGDGFQAGRCRCHREALLPGSAPLPPPNARNGALVLTSLQRCPLDDAEHRGHTRVSSPRQAPLTCLTGLWAERSSFSRFI